MNVETRGRAAAEGLRSATSVDVDAGLSRLRRTRRRREIGRVVAACAAVAALAGASFLTIDGDEKVAPVDQPEPRNGLIVNAGDRLFGSAPTLPNEGPYPLWQGADPASGSFLYASDGGPVTIVDETGTVAEIECTWMPCDLDAYPGRVAFGPGDDELTFTSSHQFGEPLRSLLIVGFDGDVREEMDVPKAALSDTDVELIAWSPDGRQLAVATDSGSGPDEVWIVSRDGSGARLVHRQQAPRELIDGRYVNEPVMVDLAWSPDGSRLGILVANQIQREEGDPADPSHPLPRLIAVPVDGGEAQTLHTYDFRDTHSTVPANFIRNWAFAWSPDGKRIAVTHEGGIAEISATDGTLLVERPGFDEYGPLVWLPDQEADGS